MTKAEMAAAEQALEAKEKELQDSLATLEENARNRKNHAYWAGPSTDTVTFDRADRFSPRKSYGTTAPYAAEASEFRDPQDFVGAVMKAYLDRNNIDERLKKMCKSPTGLAEALGADGGFLLPPDYVSKIFERTYNSENLIARTDQYTLAGNSIIFPRNNETSRATGSRWGGVRGYWLNEGAQGTASKPGFGRLTLTLNKLMVLIYATDELLADVGVMEQYITRVGSDEISFLLGDAIVNGDGVGKPTGFKEHNSTVTVSAETGQAAATICWENIVKMWSRLFGQCRKNAVWLIHQDIEPQLFTMAQNVGTGGLPVYLPPGGASAAPYATLMGRPVIPIEQAQTLGTKGDITLVDLGEYVSASKGGIQAATSMHLRFDYDEMAFRLIVRTDGAPWWATALTPYKGNNTQSWCVNLATRS